jgi:hypothetical protein
MQRIGIIGISAQQILQTLLSVSEILILQALRGLLQKHHRGKVGARHAESISDRDAPHIALMREGPRRMPEPCLVPDRLS